MNTFMDGIKTQKSKEKQPMQLQKGRPLTLVRDDCDKINTKSAAEEAVKLAAIAMSFNVRLRSSDMPPHMQAHALRCTRSLLDSSNPPATVVPPTTKAKTRPNPTHIARALKKVFTIQESKLKVLKILFFFFLKKALCGGSEFRIVRDSLTRWFRLLLYGLALGSALQNRGQIGHSTIKRILFLYMFW